MTRLSHVEIGGRLIAWREIVRLRKEQREKASAATQPTRFEVKLDVRPKGERTAECRYFELSLFGDRL